MRERCPNARYIGVGKLDGYTLDFTIYAPHRGCGAADIVLNPHDSVSGLVYELDNDDLSKLDRIEGSPIHYRRVSVNIELLNERKDVFAYEVVNKSQNVPPSHDYLNLLKQAAKQYGFPASYRSKLDAILPL